MKLPFLVLFIGLSNLGHSQNHDDVYRKAFVFGTAIGASHTMQTIASKKERDLGLGLDLKVGFMVQPNLALLLTSNISGYHYSGIGRDRARDFGVVAPAVQYWLQDKLWILVGAGLGVDAPIIWDIKKPALNKDETRYYTGFGAVAAFGYDIYRKKNFTIDIKARVSYRRVALPEGRSSGISPAVLLGINFY